MAMFCSNRMGPTERTTISFPILLLSGLLILSVGCEDTCYDGELNQTEEGIDCGGDCVPCDSTATVPPEPTCFDGILNQDETDIDCGGATCAPCSNDTTAPPPPVDQLCTGNGTSDRLPLVLGNYWKYTMNNGATFTLTVADTSTVQGELYYKMVSNGPYPSAADYYRSAPNGDYYRIEADGSGNPVGSAYLYLDADAAASSGWTVAGVTIDSLSTTTTNGSVISQNGCTYSSVITLQDHSFGTTLIQRSYTPGIGVVEWEFSGGVSSAYLDSVALF